MRNLHSDKSVKHWCLAGIGLLRFVYIVTADVPRNVLILGFTNNGACCLTYLRCSMRLNRVYTQISVKMFRSDMEWFFGAFGQYTHSEVLV